MSDATNGGPAGGQQLAEAGASLRARMAALSSAIDELRAEADRLSESARSRAAVAVLERPAVDLAPVAAGPMPDLARLDRPDAASVAPLVAPTFPASPFETTPDPAPAPTTLPAEPRPPLDHQAEATTPAPAGEPTPPVTDADPAVPAAPSPSGTEGTPGAKVLEFPTGGRDAAASDEPAFGFLDGSTELADTADEPAFGDLGAATASGAAPSTRSPAAEDTPAAAAAEAAAEPVSGVTDTVNDGEVGDLTTEADASFDDGLDAIGTSESTQVPHDWDDDASGDEEAAFDKFFSNDVEPEPAQRWLLNDN